MESTSLTDKVQELDELELAALVCLIANQHCIVDADTSAALHDVEQKLQSAASDTFELSCAVVDCNEKLTVEDFSNAILTDSRDEDESIHPSGPDEPSYFSREPGRIRSSRTSRFNTRPGASLLDSRRVADIVIAKNLNVAHHHVQIQALELIRGKRIFTRTAVHAAPKRFLFIALICSNEGGPLLDHLNDQFCLSHPYSTADHANDVSTPYTPGGLKGTNAVQIQTQDVDYLQTLASEVRITAEVRGYLHNILTFLRAHRAVAGGISATATRHLNVLVRALAPLHALTFVPPSLVALAVRKVYSHRLLLVAPEDERSLQWGSDVEAVKELLEGLTVEDVIEDVLKTVEVPL
ncbi:MAG: hypothetical protein M1820_003308 [Bogoriella megaspora]|nr:MAG: hypothetical protein M1820_003308 [Bogoriella megaspora]